MNVSVTGSPDEHDASLDAAVSSGEMLIRREFVTAEAGDIVTLSALIGSDGKAIDFQFLPAGGETETPHQKSLASHSRMLSKQVRPGAQPAENEFL